MNSSWSLTRSCTNRLESAVCEHYLWLVGVGGRGLEIFVMFRNETYHHRSVILETEKMIFVAFDTYDVWVVENIMIKLITWYRLIWPSVHTYTCCIILSEVLLFFVPRIFFYKEL